MAQIIDNSKFETNVQQMINDINSNVLNMVQTDSKEDLQQKDMKSKIVLGVSAVLPGVLALISLLLGLPSFATVAVAFLGGISGAALQIYTNKENSFHPSLEEDKTAIETFKTSQEDKVRELKKYINEYIKKYQNEIQILENRISNMELAKKYADSAPQPNLNKSMDPSGYDITVDRKFGEWAQRFLAFANKSDDRAIARMGDELVTRLATMKIKVYDEPILNSEGKPDVPFFDYLIDESDGENYTEVVKPLIYSDRSLLARGEIR